MPGIIHPLWHKFALKINLFLASLIFAVLFNEKEQRWRKWLKYTCNFSLLIFFYCLLIKILGEFKSSFWQSPKLNVITKILPFYASDRLIEFKMKNDTEKSLFCVKLIAI